MECQIFCYNAFDSRHTIYRVSSPKKTEQFSDHIMYAGMLLETSSFDRTSNVDINNLSGYKERTHILYMIPILNISKMVCLYSYILNKT